MAMSSNKGEIPDDFRWEVYIKCIDCKETFLLETPHLSTDRLDNGGRIVLFASMPQCPSCKNLRVVKE